MTKSHDRPWRLTCINVVPVDPATDISSFKSSSLVFSRNRSINAGKIRLAAA